MADSSSGRCCKPLLIPHAIGMIFVLVTLSLCSCSSQPAAPTIPVQESTLATDGRITVKRVATFRDRFAFNGEREILIITDTKTGKEFIGISGVGVTETREVVEGKVSRQIEQ